MIQIMLKVCSKCINVVEGCGNFSIQAVTPTFMKQEIEILYEFLVLIKFRQGVSNVDLCLRRLVCGLE